MVLGGQDLPAPNGLYILWCMFCSASRLAATLGGMLPVAADFWLEDEEAYKVRNKAITAGALVLMIANSQGAE